MEKTVLHVRRLFVIFGSNVGRHARWKSQTKVEARSAPQTPSRVLPLAGRSACPYMINRDCPEDITPCGFHTSRRDSDRGRDLN